MVVYCCGVMMVFFVWCRAGLQMIDIQEMLGDAVNNLVKHFYKPERDVSTPASPLVLISC